MIFLSELKNMKLYKKQFHLPIVEKNKRKGSAIILITPNIESSIRTLNSKLFINKYHKGYYIEKDITYFIKNDSPTFVNESVFINSDYKIRDSSMIINTEEGQIITTLDGVNSINEDSKYNNVLKKLLYEERLRRPDDLYRI